MYLVVTLWSESSHPGIKVTVKPAVSVKNPTGSPRSCDITSYSAVGKLGSDEFATASLKNYSEDLCTAMTKVLQACLLRYAPKSNSGDDLALDEFTVTPLCKI